MGYTHYASRRKRLTLREFKTAANDCQKVVEALCSEKGIRIQFDRDDPRPAHFGVESVRFNGVGDEAHETFAVERDYRVESWNSDPKRGEGWFEFTRNSRSLSWEPSHSAQYEGELPEVHFFPGSIA